MYDWARQQLIDAGVPPEVADQTMAAVRDYFEDPNAPGK
jgi:hypothetical protein